MSRSFGYLHLEILLRVILSWNNSKVKFLQDYDVALEDRTDMFIKRNNPPSFSPYKDFDVRDLDKP
jgi:hypothetical protein